MSEWYFFYAFLIFLSIIGGLYRVLKGPTRADRMLATQICGTSTAAILLLLAFATDRLYLCDIALVFAMLASIVAIAFVQLTWRKKVQGGSDDV
ncbi:MAG: monovalent cation/H+ antiporter complex subunit F [Waddliaceae bacterium]